MAKKHDVEPSDSAPASATNNTITTAQEKPLSAKTSSSPIDQRLALLKKWLNGITTAHVCHCKLEAKYKERSRQLGLTVTVISTIVGTSIFASLNLSNNQLILVVAGVISVTASILAGVNTYLNYGDLAITHSKAASRWGALRRHVERISMTTADLGSLDSSIKEIEKSWSALSKNTPPIPEKMYAKVSHELSMPKPKDRWE